MLGTKGKSSLVNGELILTKEGVRVEVLSNSKKIYRLYTNSNIYHFKNKTFPIGMTKREIELIFGKGKVEAKGYIMELGGVLLTYNSGITFGIKNNKVVGVGVWQLPLKKK